MKSFRSRLARLFTDRGGGITVIFALTMVPLAFITAFSIDYAHSLTMRQKMQSLVDEVLLASAMAPVTSDMNPYHARYGDKQPGGQGWQFRLLLQLSKAIQEEGIDLIVYPHPSRKFYFDPARQVVGVTHLYRTKSLFASILPDKFKFIAITGEASLGERSDPIEIALVFDISSSMTNAPGKWNAARTQGKAFVENVMRNPYARVALVPFGNRVAVDNLRLLRPDPVHSDNIGLDTSNTIKMNGAAGPTEYFNYKTIEYSPSNSVYKLKYLTGPTGPEWQYQENYKDVNSIYPVYTPWYFMDKTFCPEAPGPFSTITDNPPDYFIHWFGKWDIMGPFIPLTGKFIKKVFPCPPEENMMISLNWNSQVIQDRIQNLIPKDEGTRIDHGLLWGWYNLSPKWKGKLRHATIQTSNDPNLPSSNAKKYIVMFTDGENYPTVDFYSCLQAFPLYPIYKPDNSNKQNPDKTGCFTNQTQSGFNPLGPMTKEEFDRDTLSLCTNIKNAGIEIFYVQFQTNNTSLNSCASGTDHFFNTQTSGDLQQAFQKIHEQMKVNIRITR
jgi:hypothetical protein